MKEVRLIGCLWCLLGIFSSVTVCAQKMVPMTRSVLDSLMNPKLLEGGENFLGFEQTEHNIGTLLESDAPRTVYFTFRNVSNNEITVTRVRTFCGCTDAACDNHTLKPGEKSRIALTYQPKNHPGTVDESAYVYTTVSEYPVARLRISGEVKETDEWRHLPSAIGDLRLKRKQIVFRKTGDSSMFTERIMCANSGKRVLKLWAEDLPAYATFQMEPQELEPGQEGDLVLRIDAGKLPSTVKGFCFMLDGADASAEERVIEVIIEPVD